MAQQHTVSLKDMWAHVRALDKLISTAWFGSGSPAVISYEDVRKHARSIVDMVGEDTGGPRTATATSPPKAADSAPKDLRAILGITHIRKG